MTFSRLNHCVGRATPFIVASTMLAAAATANAGIIVNPPDDDAYTWLGGSSSNWNNAANWNTNSVPGEGDAVIITSGAFNPVLQSDTALVNSIFIGVDATLYNSGHLVGVSGADATTTISGNGSRLFLTANGADRSFDTDFLDVQNNGELRMQGGWAQIDARLRLLNDGKITGFGLVEILGNMDAAFSGAGGSITSQNGMLEIQVVNGGNIALPGEITVEENSELFINGPLFNNLFNLDLTGDSTIAFSEDWTIVGTLNATGGNGTSVVDGDGDADINGEVNVSSNTLAIEARASFGPAGDISIGSVGTLEINDFHTADAGHTTTLGATSTLRFNGAQFNTGWNGDISAFGGTIEANSPFGGWNMYGTLNMGSAVIFRSRLEGTARTNIHGELMTSGVGPLIFSDVDIRPNAMLTVANGAPLTTNAELTLRDDSQTSGGGVIEINKTGRLVIEEGASVVASIQNAGEFDAGTSDDVAEIGAFGHYDQLGSGRLNVDITGVSVCVADHYQFVGTATLAGELHVELADGAMTPDQGDEFIIITAGSVVGEFDTISGMSGFVVDYFDNTVVLTYEGFTLGDLNMDGFVNGADLLILLNAWGNEDSIADLDGSGMVDGGDLLILLNNWG